MVCVVKIVFRGCCFFVRGGVGYVERFLSLRFFGFLVV